MKNLVVKYREIISYVFWGGMTTLVSWLTYGIFVAIIHISYDLKFLSLHMSADILLSNLLSWVCAISFAFVTNKMWVFCSKSWKKSVVWPELYRFVSARIATGIIEIIAVPVLVAIGLNATIFGIEGAMSKIIVSIVVIVLNYILSKIFVFKNK